MTPEELEKLKHDYETVLTACVNWSNWAKATMEMLAERSAQLDEIIAQHREISDVLARHIRERREDDNSGDWWKTGGEPPI